MNILHSIGAGIAAVGIFIASLFGFTPEPTEQLGADTNLFAGLQTFTLAGTGISSSATSFSLTSFTLTQNGKEIQDSDLSDTFYLTLEPGSRTRQEFISCTTVVQNSDETATISGCIRGLSPIAPYTASSSLQFAHNGGTSVIFSNSPQFYEQFPAKGNDETITGTWTFTTFPITPSTTIASATTSGGVELATGGEAASSTLSGDIAASKLGLHTGISTSSAPSSGNVVVVTGDDGNIDAGFLPDAIGSTTVRVYTASTTYTRPTGLKHIVVEVQGAGGDGSTDGSGGDAGGGGGGYAKSLLTASQLSATTSIVIGAAGAGTGNTSFGSITAGNGADASGATGAAGGTASGGNILNINGETSLTIVSFTGGDGGDSVLGKGGEGGHMGQDATSAGGNAQAGFGYGAGGGGTGASTDGSPQGNASTGTTGVVIITEYF